MILHGDSLHELTTLADDSIDFICTDPPYGYSFMGKDWDKAVPSVEIWQQCLRVLKTGAFMCVMSAPRSDVQNAMISRLMEAGFRLDFTPIYWTYASGFPKAGDVTKLAMKKLGDKGELSGTRTVDIGMQGGSMHAGRSTNVVEQNTYTPTDERIKPLQGAKTGFQPKPAVEVIIVAMKPLSEKTYVDQALANGHGISWLDEGRIPTGENLNGGTYSGNTEVSGKSGSMEGGPLRNSIGTFEQPQGRFPANLLVSDDVLNDGVERKSGWANTDTQKSNSMFLGEMNETGQHYGDSGSYSRYFDLDKWASTLPFLITPKASKSEKNKGLDAMPEKFRKTLDGGSMAMEGKRTEDPTGSWQKNHHPTVKPLKLMSYLITLFSRPGDTVLDPFCGSGSTNVAAHNLGRETIGIEREAEYVEIARARLAHVKPEVEQLPEEKPEPAVPPVTIKDITELSQLTLL